MIRPTCRICHSGAAIYQPNAALCLCGMPGWCASLLLLLQKPHQNTAHEPAKRRPRCAKEAQLKSRLSGTEKRHCAMSRIGAMQNEAHTRAPDANHGAWLLPLEVEATTAPVVRHRSKQPACLVAHMNRLKLGDRGRDGCACFIPKKAARIRNRGPRVQHDHRR